MAGRCDARFTAVRDALEGNFRDHDELGAAVHVRVGGRSVVDLWGGHRDLAGISPWQHDTLVNVYSVGKRWQTTRAGPVVDAVYQLLA